MDQNSVSDHLVSNLEPIVTIIRKVAQSEILPRFRNLKSTDVSCKSSLDDPVTVADLAAEALIASELSALFPKAYVVGEEAFEKDPTILTQVAQSELAFIIDPIDGTWNFANGISVFGIILAATHFGKPVFGLLYDPLNDDYQFSALSVGKALHISKSGQKNTLEVAKPKPPHMLNGLVSIHLFDRMLRADLSYALSDFNRITSLQCSCHEYRLVAQGAYDFCLSAFLKPWDHLAGSFIVQQAGGYARMLDGSEYSPNMRQGHLLTANSKSNWMYIRDKLVAIL
ncbi:MAG: inositol monophosphatase [Rhodobacteraceae bacterium]|jgi:fructose-1,6-bisphosphatase/inositol monophosphatase family enzyme|nr:inositol monophosphatase [Paracoccaceae bacterium]